MTYNKNRQGRLSRRDLLLRNKAALDFVAAAADKTHDFQTAIPPKRNRIKRSDGTPAHPLEKDVLADVLRALRADPRVAFVDRRQAGVFQDGDRWIRVGQKGVLDISGMLQGGAYFELEVKRDEKHEPNPMQKERIWLIKRSGGISGYCWSAESALALLPCE